MKLVMITQKVDTSDDIMGFSHQWVTALARHVDHLHVITLHAGETDLPDNVTLYSLGKENGNSRLKRAFLFYTFAFKIIPQIDGIFAHMCPEYVRALWPIARWHKKPIGLWYAHVRVSNLAKKMMKHVAVVFSPSGASFETELQGKLRTTGHGIDTDLFIPPTNTKDNTTTHLLYIGRISHIKDIDIIIEALDILINKKKRTDVVLDIYGKPARKEDDAYMQKLKDIINDKNLNEYVVWHGAVKNTETVPVYQSSHIFVRPQSGAGFGKTDLEAMAVGLPVVTTTPVYKDALGGDWNDLFFGDGNSLECAEKIEDILGWSDQQKEKHAHEARAFVIENHNLDRLMKKIADTFKQHVRD